MKTTVLNPSTMVLPGFAVIAIAASFVLHGCGSTPQTSQPGTSTQTSAVLLEDDEPSSEAPRHGATDRSGDEFTIRSGDVVNLTVWGMSCPKCVSNVDQLLLEVPGVESTTTDMSSGVVTVQTGWPAPSESELRAAVEQAGFTLMGLAIAGQQG